jgi:hypothetical protein
MSEADGTFSPKDIKMIAVLFAATQLSDVGCTTRLISKEVYKKIQPYFTVGQSHFGLEMLLLVVMSKVSFVEIPIHYLPRIGESAVTGSFKKTLKLGFTMIAFLLKMRLKLKLIKQLQNNFYFLK